MKKLLYLALSSLLAFPAPAFSQMTRIGVAGAVSGKVGAFRPPMGQAKPVGRVIESGKELYLGDKIVTGPGARLQIMLKDETIFTIGPNSSMVLDEFVYDPSNENGRLVAKITRGFFRFVTGRIGHKDPSKMRVDLPIGTIGIRGTIVAGQVMPDGTAMAVLLGPGPASTSFGDRPGAITLQNQVSAVEVDRPGFASRIEGAQMPPTPPFLVPPQELSAIMDAVGAPTAPSDHEGRQSSREGARGEERTAAREDGDEDHSDGRRQGPPQGQGQDGEENDGPDRSRQHHANHDGDDSQGPGRQGMRQDSDHYDPMNFEESPTEMAGQDYAYAQGDLSETESVGDLTANLDNNVKNAALDAGELLFGRVSNWEDVGAVVGGTAYYQGSNSQGFTQYLCSGSACEHRGTMSFAMNIDFGARTVGGGGSMITFESQSGGGSIPTQTVSFAQQSFDGYSGPAIIHKHSATTIAAVTLQNGPNGEAAYNASAGVIYADSATQNAGLGVVSGARYPGSQ